MKDVPLMEELCQLCKTSITKNLHLLWPLQDIALFETEAQLEANRIDAARFAAMDAASWHKLIRRLPDAIKSTTYLPSKDQDYEQLVLDCDRAATALYVLFRAARLSCIQQAVEELPTVTNVRLVDDFQGCGLLVPLVKPSEATEEKKTEILTILETEDKAPGCS